MEKAIYLAGVGGQGLQLAGKVLVSAANQAGFQVTYSPKYGYEKRGGLSSCYLVIGDEEIGNPRKPVNDVLVLIEKKLFNQVRGHVKADGIFIANAGCIPDQEYSEIPVKPVEIDFFRCCEEMGSQMAISMLVVGAVAAALPDIFSNIPALEKCIEEVSRKPKINEMNQAAFKMGYEQYRCEVEKE